MILARTFPTAITTVPVTVNQDMKALTPKPELNAEFLVSNNHPETFRVQGDLPNYKELLGPLFLK